MFSGFSTWLRRVSKTRAFAEGERFRVSDYNHIPFNNNYQKLVDMYQARMYHENNTPYQVQCDKYTH